MRLYDTLSGTKREFAPSTGEVMMYVCGPNLYGPSHIGHALSYVVFDVLRRYLEYLGYRVRHVQNFTDIEDHIIEVAQKEGRSINELAEHYIQRFLPEMDDLGVQRAHHYPRATEYIDRMIEIIQNLVAKGHAYVVDGDVYFRVRTFAGYGQLSKRSLEEMKAGARLEVDPRKEDHMDFVLWKASKEGEPSWPTPWGPGRPGWHIECSAMSLSLLGDKIDIHGGGQDVIFPHHENEIAQSEVYTGTAPFVRFWVHNGLLRLPEGDEEKMTRHRGNFVSCREALDRYHPDAIRLFLISSHYHSPRVYNEEEIQAQERAAERLRIALREISPSGGETMEAKGHRQRFEEAMDDDLNTPQALAALFDLTREINRCREEGKDVRDAQETLRQLATGLGLSLEDKGRPDHRDSAPFIELLVETRARLRADKHWKSADFIRTELEDLGVSLEDTPHGTRWRLNSS